MRRSSPTRTWLSLAAGLLLPVSALLVWAPTAASAATPSLGVSVQVCTTAPLCYWEYDTDWASTTAVPSGETVFWRVSITNTGDVPLTDIVTNDTGVPDCAGGVTAGPLQPGQVTAYSCQSDSVTGPMTNTASATGTPPSGPDVTSSTSSASVTTTSGTVDPNANISAVVQVCTLAFGPDCDPFNAADWSSTATVYNAEIWFRVVVTNTGTDPLSTIDVISSLPPSESDCGGTVTPSLAAGASYTYECELNNVIAPATETQTVWAAGDPATGPFVASANSTATAQDEPSTPPAGTNISALLQICTLANQGSCDPTNPADWTTSATLNQPMARWRVVITNTGTAALTNIYGEDLLSQSDCGGFVQSSLAAGASTQYECQTNNVTQTTTNTVSVAGYPPSGAPAISAASSSTAVVNGYVQGSAFETGTQVTSLTVTLNGPVHAGDMLVGWVSEYGAAGHVTVADNVNGAWTRSPAAETFGGTGDIALFYRPATAASPTGLTVTITAPAGAYLQGSIAEYTGIATSNPLDHFSVAEGTGTTVSAGPTVSAPAGELVYSAFVTGGIPGTVTPGSSQGVTFWPRAATSSNSAYQQDIISANAGAQTASATLGTSTNWYAVVATFLPASTGLPVTTPPSVPTGLAVTSDTASSVGLRWNASTGAAGYTVYRNGTAVGTTAATSYTDATVSASTTYQYTVDAFDAGGGHSAQSNALSASTPAATPSVAPAATTAHGYWLVGSDGGVFSFGSAVFHGSMGATPLQRPVVGMVATPDRGGYWLDASDGGVFSFGDTQFYGSIPGLGLHPAGSGLAHSLNAPIVGMVASHDQGGYFMVASDGGVFAFGDAKFAGSCPGIGGCAGAAVAVMPDASGNGYWLITSTGNVYAFGDAPYFGAPGHGTVTSAVATPDGKGYWILLSDGEVLSYGDATPLGWPSSAALSATDPATAIFATSDGAGYWVVSALGAVYNFGDAPDDGGMAGTHLNGSIIAASGS